MRRIIATVAAGCLMLAGCGSNEDKPAEEPTSTEQPDQTGLVISDEGMPELVEKGDKVRLDFTGAKDPGQLQLAVVKEGDGKEIDVSDLVVVNYVGQVWGNDEPFDSSFDRQTPATFNLAQLIPGWRDGLVGQKAGSRVVLSIPAELGYGPSGGNEDAGIGPDDTIAFGVDILRVLSADQAGEADAHVVAEEKDLPITITSELGAPPEFSVKKGAKPPTQPKIVVIAEGSGEKVGGEGTTVYLQYAATLWNGEINESSMDKGGLQDTVIGPDSTWGLLSGVPVGSRVLLLTPGEKPEESVAALVDIVDQMPGPKA